VLSLPPSVKIFVASGPTDMRRSFDGLCAMAQHVLLKDPFSGHLFVFCNRRRDRVKILFWDRSGFVLWCKRLEEGTFHLPSSDATHVEMESAELALVLEGIDLDGAKRRKRYRRKPPCFHLPTASVRK